MQEREMNHNEHAADILRAVDAIVSSEQFRKARRMCALLRFLVDQKLQGKAHETTEYTVGIHVFRRDPATYDTCTDPIVRVQVGRLRQRLASYYATASPSASVQFRIPVGSYLPVFETHRASQINSVPGGISVSPVMAPGGTPDLAAFAKGLNDELYFQLFNAFRERIAYIDSDNATPAGIAYRLDVSLRNCAYFVRTWMRLVDVRTGQLAWSARMDQFPPYTIATQESMAISISNALRAHFGAKQSVIAQSPPGMLPSCGSMDAVFLAGALA